MTLRKSPLSPLVLFGDSISTTGLLQQNKQDKMTSENTSVGIEYDYEDLNNSKRPKLVSKVWEDMLRIQTSDGSKVQCKHCGKLLQDNCGTSHLKRHLIICPKRPKTLDGVNQDLMASPYVRRAGFDKEFGPNTVLMVRPLKVEPESQISCFPETPTIHGSAITACSAIGREQHQKAKSTMMLPNIESPRNQMDLTLDDVEMRAFYASLDAETSVVSPAKNTRLAPELPKSTPCEETEKALKTLQDFLSKDFSVLLHPGQSNVMKSTLEYLSNLSEDDEVSIETRLLITEVSREFTRWSCDYNDASRKIESSTTNLLKADKIEESLEANKNQFKEVASLENELSNQLTSLEEKKKELEEQINAIKANICVFQSAKNTATKRKREIFEEGKTLKTQRDELKEQAPHLRDEWELAKKTQANIRAEWSKLGEKFSRRLGGGVNCEYFDSNNRSRSCSPEE
ncbi:TMV resistance protein N [Senna tora]|uniref:TMV resistance protein N n=1 Tax=Senna tora TaxID=362788 RepID=A0A834TDT2_9FABA|nr:TMV resistance protein N [Senna tora]